MEQRASRARPHAASPAAGQGLAYRCVRFLFMASPIRSRSEWSTKRAKPVLASQLPNG